MYEYCVFIFCPLLFHDKSFEIFRFSLNFQKDIKIKFINAIM